MKTSSWILEGYDSKEEYEKAKGITSKKKKGKTFEVKVCPECGSTSVAVILGEAEGRGSNGWECKACKWTGKSPHEKELNEKEFLEHLDRMGVK